MKKLFLSLVAAMIATVSFAQNTLVATLSHGEDISMYYGTYALKNAYNASVSGDIINLSGGSFQAVDIKKGITLRGTGISDSNPTIIAEKYTINIPETDENRLTMEGIRCTGAVTLDGTYSSPYFLKSQFSSISCSSSSSIMSAMFINCRITSNFYLSSVNSTVYFINSYVYGFSNSNTAGTKMNASFINCVLTPSYGNSFGGFRSSYFLNSVLYCTSTYDTASLRIPSTSIAQYCVGINAYYLFDDTQYNKQSNKSCSQKDFFGSGYYDLSDDAKTKYLGDDGTEVGLYGGMMPYTSIPSYPQITKMNVANRTTNDGKLSVEIEVSAVE